MDVVVINKNENGNMKTLFVIKSVVRMMGLLAMEQKQRSEVLLIECLMTFFHNKAEILRRFITMKET